MALCKNMAFWFGGQENNGLKLFQIFMFCVTIFMMTMQLLKKFDNNPTRQWIGGI
jgi:uncharacterized membrane protein